MNAESQQRLRWQCRRGMLELDILLEEFLEGVYADLTELERRSFVKLLTFPDQLLYDYLMGEAVPPDKEIAHVVGRIRGTSAA